MDSIYQVIFYKYYSILPDIVNIFLFLWGHIYDNLGFSYLKLRIKTKGIILKIIETSTEDNINYLTFWNNFLSSNFTPSYIKFIDKNKFKCRADITFIQDIKLTLGQGSAHRDFRIKNTKNHNSKAYNININFSGIINIIQGEQKIVLKPKEFTFLDQEKNYCIFHESNYQMLTIEIPKYILNEQLRQPDLYSGLKFNGNEGLACMAYTFFQSLPQVIRKINPKELMLLKDTLINLVINTFKSMDKWTELTTIALNQLQRAQNIIATNLHDASFTRSKVSQMTGVSIRELNRLFASQGTSITRYIKQQRLILAKKLLLEPSFQKVTISEIAYRVGFSDLSHFSHSFSTQFTLSPKEYRKKYSRKEKLIAT